MKIKQITETTTSGSIATVNSPLGGTQSRGNPSIYGGKKVGSLFKGKKTSAPYANSINESAEISEADLSEQDLIVVPGQGRKSKTGFVQHGQSRIDHEVEMARSDLFSAAKNAQQVYSMIKNLSEEEGLEGWVQEKIIKANDYLNTIREYLEGKQVQGVDESIENNPVANALINYIMKHRPDLLKHGADRVGNAIDRIASRAGNVRNINPDDLNKLIRQVEYYVTSNTNDMYEGVGSAINVSKALQAMKQLANTTNRHISTKTYNGLLDWDDGNLAEIVVNAIKACTTLSNYYKNNNQLDYARLINKLQSELIAFKNGDAFETIKQLSQGTLSKINFQQGVAEGAKVDRMVKHIEKSEEKAGKSKDEAENIAWATANKRGMLDNKNKKA